MDDRLLEKQRAIEALSDDKLVLLALSEILTEIANGQDVSLGVKIKLVALASMLNSRVGVRF